MAALISLGCASSAMNTSSHNRLHPFHTQPAVVPAFPVYNELTRDLLSRLNAAGGWHLVLGEGGRAEATIADREMRVEIVDGGTIWWAVQVSFMPLRLETGRDYVVRFEARADQGQPMILDIAQVGTWHSYSPRIEFQLTAQWQAFEAHFSMGQTPSEPNARFEFNLGHQQQNRICFRNVVVSEASPKAPGAPGSQGEVPR